MAFADWTNEEFSFVEQSMIGSIFNQYDFENLSDEEVQAARDAFERGWLDFNGSEEDRYEARLEFADIMGYPVDFTTGAPQDFDWDEFRDIYDSV